ncbi:zinc-binding dehydrogenase [Amycolatopsis sp. K13G38]|uniref:Zinc-binding dehydrogenase n=1 Tax=Amycolatopsis acididurans TaxID=2724524 RepID=A0ABX1JBB2_9PSEU|nr:zinc-binding dehydrogenase [Amycolatopsis acididurans]NKQ56184.1 zinc-binding dehydrogenase [Amycolatopsis acididurans]
MRAFVIEEFGRHGVRDDVETLELGPRDVRVQIKAAGVCRTDLSATNGKWPTALPLVAGHEGAGIIVEVGEQVTDRQVGQHVMIDSPACGQCYLCTHGSPQFCERRDLSGSQVRFKLADGTGVHSMIGRGTWSEEIVVDASAAIVLPKAVPFDVASVIGCAVRTGTGQVINVAKPEAGSSAIFFGGGGIGACAIMGAKLAGCGTIVAVDPATPKHESLLHFGATHAITPDEVQDAIHNLTDGRGFDYSFENVGRPETLRAAWDAARTAGTVVITGLGGTQGRVEFDLNELSVHGKTLRGNVGGNCLPQRDPALFAELYLLGKLDLDSVITNRLKVDEFPDALKALDEDPTILRQVVEFD